MNDMSIIEIGYRLDNLNCHCDIVMDQGMAEVNWSKFEGAIHDAIEAVNYRRTRISRDVCGCNYKQRTRFHSYERGRVEGTVPG